MKILIPVFSFGKAGGFRVLAELANKGNMFGHEVHFVCPSKTVPYYKNDIKIIYIDRHGNISSFEETETGGAVNLSIALWRYLRKNSGRYDIVIANYWLTAYPILFGSKSVNIYYIQAYEPDFLNEISSVIKRIFLKFLAWMTYFFPFIKIVNSNFYKKYKNINANYVVEPGLDLSIFFPKEQKCLTEKLITVGCIGRIEKWKGCEDIGAAIEILHNKAIPVKLKVAFNKIDYPHHEIEQPHGDINLANFYRSVDIFVAVPYIQIGAVHYPVLESMACGTLVITTGYEPADETNSYIVPIKSPEAIAQTIINVISNKSLFIKKVQKAQSDVRKFSWDIISTKFYHILEIEREREAKL
jgi:glycosyltransferase involved in cell wall biosynthesis